MEKEEYFAHENLNQSKLKTILMGGLWAFDNYQMSEETDDDPRIYKDDALVYGNYFEDMLAHEGTVPEGKYFIAPRDFKFPTAIAAIPAHNFVRNNGDLESEFDILNAMEGSYGNIKDKIKRLATFYSSCKDYVIYLRESGDKQAISQKKVDLALLHYNHTKDSCVYYEKTVQPKSSSIELRRSVKIFVDNKKLELDILEVNHDLKTLTVIDVKTCSNAETDFIRNFFKYRYDFQMCFYIMYVKKWAEIEYPGYTVNDTGMFFVGSSRSLQPPVMYTHPVSKGEEDYIHEGRKFLGVKTALNLYEKSLSLTDLATRYNKIKSVLGEI